MPTAIGGRPSGRGGRPRRQRRSMAVTMRPRKLSTPAISGSDNGTRVNSSGMNTSCTRAIGRPNNWPSSTTVTYSVTHSAPTGLSVVMASSRCLDPLQAGLLQGRDQALAVEFGDEIIEAGPASALDHGFGSERGKRDQRHIRSARLAAHGLGKLVAGHAGHLDVGHDDVELPAGFDDRERLLGPARGGDFVAGGLEH